MAASTSTLRGAFPNPRTRLIGRTADRAAARSLLLDDAVPLLTLIGPGGVGKTRLALAIAQDVAAHFPDGVVWVDLAPLADAALVPAAVAAALALTLPPDRPALDAIIARLRRQQRLLLLDNCEHVAPAAADLVAALLAGCPAAQVLATSRAPLQLHAEHVWSVPTLAPPPADAVDLDAVQAAPAVALFAQRARAADPRFAVTTDNAAAVAELCRRLDGLPLALELAAGRTPTLAPAAMLALLSERFQVLAPGPRDAPARQKTMRGAIAWSYALLSPEEQRVFRALSVFAGGWTVTAAAAVTARSVPATLDQIDALLRQSMIVAHPRVTATAPRFTMLETIRDFGLECLRASGEEPTARDRHAAYFHGFIASLDLHHALPGDPAWFDAVAPEEANLRLTLERFAAQGDALALCDLCAALDVFWLTRTPFAEGRSWSARAIAVDAGLPPLVRARCRLDAAYMMHLLGEHDAAAPLWDEGLALARTTDDLYLLADALLGFASFLIELQCHTGQFAKHEGDLARAIAFADEGERLARGLNPSLPNVARVVGLAATVQGEIALVAGDRAVAMAHFAEAIRLQRAAGGGWILAIALIDGGLTHVGADDLDGATPLLIEALALTWGLHAGNGQSRESDAEGIRFIQEFRGLAVVAAAAQPQAAAWLLGAADRLAAQTPSTPLVDWLPQEPAAWCLARLRDTLDATKLHEERRTGATLPLDQAVALAQEVGVAVLGAARVAALWEAAQAPEPGPLPALRTRDGAPTMASVHAAASSLTFREREVLALLCQRLTDAEIAQRLFLSPRTVSRHVGSILGKLGAANRRAAAAITVRRRLV
ncbi:MAG TPA: LuxR C-terminal-related transcriptional regulator [Thermomicrobiales bacterium]|nr:LuxR C-terminal-related transcriptional regulator [Thermomicrobiales bacterium]